MKVLILMNGIVSIQEKKCIISLDVSMQNLKTTVVQWKIKMIYDALNLL